MTRQEYLALHKAQDGRCAICRLNFSETGHKTFTRLVVDHCHKTGLNRGLLCACCNLGLGHFQDNPAIIANAIAYLQSR